MTFDISLSGASTLSTIHIVKISLYSLLPAQCGTQPSPHRTLAYNSRSEGYALHNLTMYPWGADAGRYTELLSFHMQLGPHWGAEGVRAADVTYNGADQTGQSRI